MGVRVTKGSSGCKDNDDQDDANTNERDPKTTDC